jgi:hypothetical protein
VEKVSVLLKAFVIGAGILLLGGMVVLTAVIVMRASGGGLDPAPVPVAAVDLALPAGARVDQVVPDGERILLLGSDAKGDQFLAVIDTATGERLRLIRFRPDG